MSEVPSAEKDVPRPGWQQQPVPTRRQQSKCAHLAVVFAQLSAAMHAEGHEWICGCGQVFMVVSNAGRDKRLAKRTHPTSPAETRAESDPHATNGRVSTVQSADGASA